MDVTNIAPLVMPYLIRYLPAMIETGKFTDGESLDNLLEDATAEDWETAWIDKLMRKIEEKPMALNAAHRVVASPGNAKYQTVLEVELEDILSTDRALAEEIKKIFNQRRTNGDAHLITGRHGAVFGEDRLDHTPGVGGMPNGNGNGNGYHHYLMAAESEPVLPPPISRSVPGPALNGAPPWERWMSNLPNFNHEYFTGREAILRVLENGFDSGQSVQALNGRGGIGKTRIALEYASRHRDRYRVMLWGRARTKEMLMADFVAMAGLLDIPERASEDWGEAVKVVRGWLEENDGWLLILDSADDPTMAREFIPRGATGHVLLTTRAQTGGRVATCHLVEGWSPQEGALFLWRKIRQSPREATLDAAPPAIRSQAEELSRELGGLPLALEQAAAYLGETSSTLAEYLESYRSESAKLRDRRRDLPDDHSVAVSASFGMTFKQVSDRNPATADLLRLCAFMEPDAIPEELFDRGAAELGEALGCAVETPDGPGGLIEAIGEAERFSMLRRDPQARTLSLHRLLQDLLKGGMFDPAKRLWAERLVRAVNAAFPEVESTNRPECERLIQHAQALAGLIDRYDFEFPAASRLLIKVGSYLAGQARYSEAEPLYHRALTIRERVLGADHQDTATTLHHLAGLYRAQGKFGMAEQLYKRVVAVYEKAMGALHPWTAWSLSNLASFHDSLGKYGEAEPLYERALTIREQALGAEHPDTAQSLSSLADLYRVQGKYGVAERLYKRIITVYEQPLGDQHPVIVNAIDQLAVIYSGQGKVGEAEPLYERALAIRERSLGAVHPETANSLNHLAAIYTAQGKYGEAEPLYQRALAVREQALGSDHPDTAQSLNNLAAFYYSQWRYQAAEPLYERALAIRERTLGADHPDTAQSLNNLALLYSSQRKYEEAEPLYQRAIAIREKVLGPDHLNVATILENYGALLRLMNRSNEAAGLFARVREIREKAKTKRRT
ncbi:MAG TPA: tetratricopeptide repeat protein [Blastocatellia bacterium]|nr:tetratricopeptide repeat protein [Blastocatellia bacterium]